MLRMIVRTVICRKKKNTAEGSFTVEAAVILPMTVMILLFLLYLIFHMYQSVVTYHSAYQAALRASLYPEKTNTELYETAQEEFTELIGGQAIWTNGLSRQIEVDLHHVAIAYQVNTVSPFTQASEELLGDPFFTSEGEVTIRKSNPVEWIRNARILLQLAEQMRQE